jgi:trehalose 6-phosphate phosphatase
MPTIDLETVLSRRPLGLAFDIDGTLSPIAPRPDLAKLYTGVASLLEQASRKVHIAIITGRSIDSGAAMINVNGLTYVGTHGLEWSDGLPSNETTKIVPDALAYVEPSRYLLELAAKELAALPDLIIERKQIGGSLHYRRCPDPEYARQLIFSRLEEPARKANLRLILGRQVVEVKTPLAVNKGWALRKFVERFALQSVIFAGDDITDLDAILEVSHLRRKGIAALAIVVQHDDTLPPLIEHADIIVQGVDEMVKLLRELVIRL